LIQNGHLQLATLGRALVSDTPVDLTKFRSAVEERRKRQAAEAAKASGHPSSGIDDLIPENTYERSEEDQQLDKIIDSIGIVDAYTRWCGKSTPQVRAGQTEGIKVSCPIPGHLDRDPSAWLNTEKGTWFCGGCQVGGDAHDLAAYSFGYPVPGYKEGATFHELRRKMAESYGYTFIKPPGVTHPIAVAPEPEPEEPEEPEGTEATVTTLYDESDWEEIEFPTLDWRSVVQPMTFLDTYLRQTSPDDVPEEYQFWNGLVALGLALGRDVSLYDRLPVFANLFVCLLGNTGDGKSRSFSHLRRLLREALPHKWDDPASKGAHIVLSPASAEVLIHNFSKPIVDPTNPKVITHYAPVRGLVEFNELSQLTGRSQRQGNVMKPTLMEFYDMSPMIGTSSMTGGKKEAHDPFASVFTTTQPRALKELMKKSDADSGFLNRWIFASGKPKQRVAIGGAQIDITPAVKPLQDIQGWVGFGSKQIAWSAEAGDKFTQFFHETLHPAQVSDASGFLTRLDLTFKKLVLILTANIKQDVVPVEIVDQVISMFQYLTAAYEIPAAQIGNSTQIEVQETLIYHIKRWTEQKGSGMTYRELYLRIKHKKYPPDLVHKMLKILADMGMIDAVATQKGSVGRPTVRYKYVG
jgi:hypothetical protein